MDPCRTEADMGPPHSEILRGSPAGDFFFPEKSGVWDLQPKTVFLAFYQQNLERD